VTHPRTPIRGGVAALGVALGVLVIALASPVGAQPTISIRSARFGNVFVVGEPAVLAVTVTAGPDAAFRGRLRVRAVDAYGRSAGRRSRALSLPPGDSARHEFAIRVRRLGHFTIEATADGRRGTGRVSVTSTAAVVPPVGSSAAEDSGVGYFVLPADSELEHADEIASEMRRFGIRWVRLTFPWWVDARIVRPDLTDPAWLDSSSFEHWVDAFRANGIEVLGVLFGMARWASSASDQIDLRAGIPEWGLAAPADSADWELFVRTLATRTRGRVRNWEVWNEPDISLFWVSTAADFVALARTTASVLHEVDPDNRVVVNLVDRETPEGAAFYETVLTEDASVLDVFGMHYGNAELVSDAVAATPLLRPGGAIWNTEAYGAPRRHISWWLWQRAAGVARIFPFIYHTSLDDSQLEDFKRFGDYPVNGDYTPRPDAIAFRTMSDLVGSARPVGGGPVGLGYDAYTFATSAGPVVALTSRNDFGETWSLDATVELLLQIPAGVRRLTVVDLMGNHQQMRVRKGRLKLRLMGVAAFFMPERGDTLDGLQVVRSRAAGGG
jgi:hypothetical protein